jgi:hypothetical protein
VARFFIVKREVMMTFSLGFVKLHAVKAVREWW